MKLIIDNTEFAILVNGFNISNVTCNIPIISSDPTEIDRLFQDCDSFIVIDENEEQIEYENQYKISYVELRHNQELGYLEIKDGQYSMACGDVVTINLTK